MNADMSRCVSDFREAEPKPEAKEEGTLLVTSADGKGIVMRRPKTEAAPARRRKGEKANQKRMATVGAAYTVDRHVRTPEEVVAALFRDGPPRTEDRPKPKHKHVWASLSLEDGGEYFSSVDVVYSWLANEADKRNPERTKEMIHICDAQEALWQARDRYLPQKNATNIADLLHVSERVWQAAHVFYVYLARGYPMASGVIEGACRHLVKDRMERAGMHWTPDGAQHMLDVRSVYVNGDWEVYQAFRIEREFRPRPTMASQRTADELDQFLQARRQLLRIPRREVGS